MGYVRISQFQERTNSELAKAINELAKTDNLKNGLVFRLAQRPGWFAQCCCRSFCGIFAEGSQSRFHKKGRLEEAKRLFDGSWPTIGQPKKMILLSVCRRQLRTSRWLSSLTELLPAPVKSWPVPCRIISALPS